MRPAHRHPGNQSRSTKSRRGGSLRAIVLAVLAVCLVADAQTGKPTEYQVKAAYLFNFARFVKWPAGDISSNDTFSICVLGNDPFGAVLDSTVAGEHIEGKRVVARRVNNAGDAQRCRIVFVSGSEERRLGPILSTLDRSPVLTVSDISGFADHLGMIQFVMENDRVRFEVNLTAAQKAGLSLSSELLKVATTVKGQAGE